MMIVERAKAYMATHPKEAKNIKLVGIAAAVFAVIYVVSLGSDPAPVNTAPKKEVSVSLVTNSQDDNPYMMEGMQKRLQEMEQRISEGSSEWRERVKLVEDQLEQERREKRKLESQIGSVSSRIREEFEDRLNVRIAQIAKSQGLPGEEGLYDPGGQEGTFEAPTRIEDFPAPAAGGLGQPLQGAAGSEPQPNGGDLGQDYAAWVESFQRDDTVPVRSTGSTPVDEAIGPGQSSGAAQAPTGTMKMLLVNSEGSYEVTGVGDRKRLGAPAPSEANKVSPAMALDPETPQEEENYEDQTSFIPMGSIIPGILINGGHFPTKTNASKDPHPVLIRVSGESLLPNNFRYNIISCVVLASGYGSLSSARALLRSEKLSCIRQDGGVVEVGLTGYISGEDGAPGLAGEIVDRQGTIIARSLLAGFASGISQAFAPQQVPVIADTTNGNLRFETPAAGDIAAVSAFNGVSQAAEKIADFYLDMASEIFPTIEIQSGRQVDIILTSGLSLNFRQ